MLLVYRIKLEDLAAQQKILRDKLQTTIKSLRVLIYLITRLHIQN